MSARLTRAGVCVAILISLCGGWSTQGAVAQDQAVPAVGDRLSGRYEIKRRLGDGAASVVFAARDRKTGQDVAIKWSRRSSRQNARATRRMMGEFYASQRVEHPNVLRVERMDRDHDHPYLVMELLDGEPLSALMERGPFEIPEAIELLSQAMDGVHACHEQGVIHRDVKPSNIFVLRAEAGQPRGVKVIDFGLSKLLPRPGEVDLGMTQNSVVIGTPLYMAPERIRHPEQADRRGDVYAFGAILYEMLAQGHPFYAEDYNSFIIAVTTGIPKSIRAYRPEIPPGLASAIALAMARNPDHRFADLPSFQAVLRPFASPTPDPPAQPDTQPLPDTEPPKAPVVATPPSPPAPEPAPRGLWFALAGGVLAALLLARGLLRHPDD